MGAVSSLISVKIMENRFSSLAASEGPPRHPWMEEKKDFTYRKIVPEGIFFFSFIPGFKGLGIAVKAGTVWVRAQINSGLFCRNSFSKDDFSGCLGRALTSFPGYLLPENLQDSRDPAFPTDLWKWGLGGGLEGFGLHGLALKNPWLFPISQGCGGAPHSWFSHKYPK